MTDPATVDECWILGTGAFLDQAPFRKIDKVALPLALKLISMMPSADGPATPAGDEVAPLKHDVYADKTGNTVGKGFYKYGADGDVVE